MAALLPSLKPANMVQAFVSRKAGILSVLAGVSLGCASAPGPVPPQTTSPDTGRAVVTLQPLAVPEVWADTEPVAPQMAAAAPAPSDTFPISHAADRGTYESRAAALLDTLGRAGSLAEWRLTHPHETIQRAEDNREFDDGLGLPLEGAWCARAVRRERLQDERVVLRSVFFYPPDWVTPTSKALESEEPAPTRGDSLTSAVSRRLTTRYGAGRVGARLATWLASDWRNSTVWQLASASVVAAAEGSSLVSELEPWIGMAGALRPRARSAALLLADRVLEEARLPSLLEPDSMASRPRLERLGARFEQQALGGRSYLYVNNWLWEALRLDREGPIGRRALVVLLRRGFYTGPGCRGGRSQDEEFRGVIAEGERALAGSLQREIRPEIEELVAEAYGDIVYLSSGKGYAAEYFEPAEYQAEAPLARRRAIEHYDAAIRPTSDSLTRRRLGQAAWRLRAGLAPLGPRFVCVYD